jgi:hypothetical protein
VKARRLAPGFLLSATLKTILRSVPGTTKLASQPRREGSVLGFYLREGIDDQVVVTLKQALELTMVPRPALGEDSLFDEKTTAAVTAFQEQHGTARDGVVGPTTWALVGQALAASHVTPRSTWTAPQWIKNLLSNSARTTKASGIDSGIVLDLYQLAYGALGEKQRQGLAFLIEAIDKDTNVTDLRWAAYMLATVKHECAHTWQPIEEYGKGHGHAYGKPVEVTDAAGRRYSNSYYGRGYVQLTWKDNYATIGRQLGLGDELVIHPEKALERNTAYAIMSYGMRKGSFTGRSLGSYIKDAACDYKNARRIINGLDAWERIKGYAERFQTILLAAVTPAVEPPLRPLATGERPSPVLPP